MSLTNQNDFPIPPEKWKAVAKRWNLPPQERRIAEAILLNYSDRQICQLISVKQPTLRTYIKRLFLRANSKDRLGLVLNVFKEIRGEADGNA